MLDLNNGFKRTLLPVLVAVMLTGCGGGDGDDSTPSEDNGGPGVETPDPSPNPNPPTPSPGEPPTTPEVRVNVIGRLVAPDGSTPMVNATIYLPDESARHAQVRAVVGVDCQTPPTAHHVAVCTNGDGSFILSVPVGLQTELAAIKGAFSAHFTIDTRNMAADSSVDVGLIQTIAEGVGATRMAVVTGRYDFIEDVLAKSGFGSIDEFGHLVPGSQKFDLYNGIGGDSDYPETLPTFDQLFVDRGDGLPRLHDYDIVFINCGVFELDSAGSVAPTNPLITAALRTYVEAGGRLYLTDLAYDYLEQTFPTYIDFDGDDETAVETGEIQNAAEVGPGDFSVPNATVQDSHLLAFLTNVTCVDGAPCLNFDNSLQIEGFDGDWAVMDGAHDTTTAPVNFLVSGVVSDVNKPLTAAFSVGEGKVFYSSYHTEDSNSTTFLPQERVLQYLVFE